MNSFFLKNRGVIAVAIIVVSTLWLVGSGQLGLYIHPRYTVFASIMSIIGVIGIVFGMRKSKSEQASHFSTRQSIVYLAIVGFTGFSLLVSKPSTLSSDLALQRGVNAGTATQEQIDLSEASIYSPFSDSGFGSLSVKDLAGLLDKVLDPDFYSGKQVEVLGFVTKNVDNDDQFFASRFVMSCCAVDSRPVGVPVYAPGWQSDFKPNDWLIVKGEFTELDGEIVLIPEDISKIEEPKDPYVY